jgi:DNA polymerase eta
VLDRLLLLHPHLSTLPKDAPEGLDSPLPIPPPINWSKAGNILPTPDELDPEEEYSDDGYEREVVLPTWGDWCLCIGGEIMAEIRKEIWERLHYTTSAGIAHNKAMAKVSVGDRGGGFGLMG